MARPLFEIAREITAQSPAPTSHAKPYLKAMHYLLGMDDVVGDGTANAVVRLFLLYSKHWQGAVAESIRAELRRMRAEGRPGNAELLAANTYPHDDNPLSACELCDKPIASGEKYVDGLTSWGWRGCMCLHCNFYQGKGLDRGDGALYLVLPGDRRLHLVGNLSPAGWESAPNSPATAGPDVGRSDFPTFVQSSWQKLFGTGKAILNGLTRRGA